MVTIRINGEEETLTAGTVAELVAAKSDSEGGRGLAVAVNGTLVRRTEWASRRLSPGDAVEIVRAMQGG